jgi:hypothetical protein
MFFILRIHKAARDALQRAGAQLKRLSGLEKWLGVIVPPD